MKILRYSWFSNADRVQNISHSIYVTNFPDSATSCDLWNACSVYGTVVDVFIPLKKSKVGKRFAFVRFVKVHNLVRLVENLCTIWIGRHHLFANQHGYKTGSYVNAVNNSHSVPQGPVLSSAPALVLDNECLIDRDLSKYLMGKVKEFFSIPNLYTIFRDEGFPDVKLTYLRGLWVMIECGNQITKDNMIKHKNDIDNSFGRKRICIKTKHHVSILESFKIIVKGRVYMIRAKELFTLEPSFSTCKEKEYVSDDEFVRENSNNNDGQPPHDETFGDNLSSDDEVVSENNNMNNNANYVSDCNAAHTTSTGADNIDPKPQVDAPVEQSCEQVGSQTIKSGGSVLEIIEGIIQV
nr:hypothetical protein [Tanacetum cinerariifolium]